MIANNAETKIIAGNTWNANTKPGPVCCVPRSPKTNADPAYEKERMAVTRSPSCLNRRCPAGKRRSEEHTSELQSQSHISYAVFCLKKKKTTKRMLPHLSHALTILP